MYIINWNTNESKILFDEIDFLVKEKETSLLNNFPNENYLYKNVEKIFYDHEKYKELLRKKKRKDSIKKYNKSNANYDTYKTKLTIDEDAKLHKDGVSIEVKCRYCGKYFVPTYYEIRARVQGLTGTSTGISGVYCSSGCKKACPIYRQKLYPKEFKPATSREVQPELRQMCLERDNYICQKCGAKGKTVQLHCHHIKSLADDPIESADVDNTITLCKKCHKEVHKISGCGYHELRCDST